MGVTGMGVTGMGVIGATDGGRDVGATVVGATVDTPDGAGTALSSVAKTGAPPYKDGPADLVGTD